MISSGLPMLRDALRVLYREKRLVLMVMNQPSAGEPAKIDWLIKPLREHSRVPLN